MRTLLPTVKPHAKMFMLASLIGFGSLFTANVVAAPSPVPLLVEQCLRLPKINLNDEFKKTATQFNIGEHALSVSQRALVFEQQTIGLNNINDRLGYYRGFPLSAEERQGLLQCQLHLADSLSQLINQAAFTALATDLINGNNEQQQLGKQLLILKSQHLSMAEKAKLHTAQAAIRNGLSSQQFTLDIQAPKCALPAENTMEVNDPAQVDFSQTIASYLLKQQDAQCRATLWQAYQGRARRHNQAALMQILALRQEMANQAGFKDYASYSLRFEQLSQPSLVMDFLESQTQLVATTPWNIGQDLANLPAAKFKSLNTAEQLANAFKLLGRWGLEFEDVFEQELETRIGSDSPSQSTIKAATPENKQKLVRVYHQQRLLGELYINLDDGIKHNDQTRLRQSVIGQQFGQQALDLKPELSNSRDLDDLIEAVTASVTSLARGGHFYINNTRGTSQDSEQISRIWLANALKAQMVADVEQLAHSRDALASAYRKQLQVFRAKVALSFYQSTQAPLNIDLNQEFIKSFGQAWPHTLDYPYSFNAIANEGPLYYQSLWQDAVASLLFEYSNNCNDQAKLFEVLVINEASLDINEQLKAVIGEPIDASSLIQRITRLEHVKAKPKVDSGLTCLL
ncbi:M2 family metallopeptidase [Shewanella sp. A25]|nr:M2 family metallopeptidase [Shewanella shenzhenensis]